MVVRSLAASSEEFSLATSGNIILSWSITSSILGLIFEEPGDVVGLDVVAEYQGGDGRELDQDVDGWTRGILEGISDSVTNNGGDVLLSELALLVDPLPEFL